LAAHLVIVEPKYGVAAAYSLTGVAQAFDYLTGHFAGHLALASGAHGAHYGGGCGDLTLEYGGDDDGGGRAVLSLERGVEA